MLGAAIRASTVRDPVVNGYTRTVRGLVVFKRAANPLTATAPNEVKTEPIASNGRTFNAVVTQSLTAGTTNDKNALAGIVLGNVSFVHSLRGANGGPDLSVGGVFVANIQTLGSTHTLKISIAADGSVAVWVDADSLKKLTSNGGIAGTAYDYLQHTANVILENIAAYFQNLCVCSSNLLTFTNCPPSGTVELFIGNEAKQTVALDIVGKGTFDCAERSFPMSVVFNIKDNGGTIVASFKLSDVCGGDTIGAKSNTNPQSFAVSRLSTGLLFSDDFGRADGAPGANWTIGSGTWAIVGGKLQTTIVNGISNAITCAAVAARLNYHVQFMASRTPLATYLTVMPRRVSASTFYQFSIGASNDGTDNNATRMHRDTNGTYTRIAGGVAINPAPVAGVAQRITFSVIGTSQRGWVNGGSLTQQNDSTAANQANGVIAFDTFGQGVGGTGIIDDVIVCSSSTISCTNLPDGWQLRVGALVSAGAVGGTASLDIQATQMPIASIDILDATGTLMKSYAPAGGLYGGDVLKAT